MAKYCNCDDAEHFKVRVDEKASDLFSSKKQELQVKRLQKSDIPTGNYSTCFLDPERVSSSRQLKALHDVLYHMQASSSG